MADLNALIAQGAQFRQPESPLNMMAQLQTFQQGQSANQLNQMKIAEAQRGMEEANALRRLDPSSASYLQDVMRVSPEKGFAFAKSQQEAKAAGTESQIKDIKLLTDKMALLPEAYRQADTPEKYLALHQSVHADPVVGKWLNSIGATPEKGLAALQNAVQTGTFDDLRMKSMQSVSQLLEGAKPIVVSPSASVYSGNKFTQAPAAPVAPAALTTLAKLQNELAALPPGDPRRAEYVALIRKETTHAPATTVNVSTEKAYGGAFGGKMAENDINKLTTAERAPQLAESANRIIGIVQEGNVFTGPAADIKLNIARALNVTGANNQEKIANTESLIAASGQSTLDAIKSAGLGTGQGFTDKDLKFLQNIAGGTVNLTPQTLKELATLQHRAATRSVESWNKRVGEMPSSVIQGTGLSTVPIKVPPLAGGRSAGPAIGTVQEGYRFKGGNPAISANWEKQ